MKALAPNTLLQNRYLVVHLIGKGGMGDVYLAVDQRLGSAVALKRTFFSDDEMFGNAFEREAKTLARLRHPVLPKVSDHFSENDVQFLVMEHIAGDDLSKRLELAQKPFPLSWVLFWADQLLDALAYLHSHEPPIIHRDIKPQNLKLTDENSIILLDFGLSKNSEGDTRAVLSGSTGSVVGYTTHYAPMEQIRGTGTNPRSDIYALSATLYQLLTNVVPYDSLTRADALLNGMPDPTKPINEINPEVPAAVSVVILKGMELSQDKRFSNAREMQKALREAFVQLQNSMAAQTVAFNVQNELTERQNNAPDSVPLKVANNALEKNQLTSVPSNFNSNVPQHRPDSFLNQIPAPEEIFNETLRMDSPTEVSAPKQSSIKTEVFPQNSIPSKTPKKTREFSAEDVSASEDESSTGNSGDLQAGVNNEFYAAGALPFAAGQKTDYAAGSSAGSGLYNPSGVNKNVDAFATYTPARENSSQAEKQSKKIASVSAETSEKTSAKRSFIGGGIALLLLVLGASGAGWFVYNNYYAAQKTETPAAVPAPSIELPTPAPTVETVLETNTQSNSNSEVLANDIDSNSSAESNTSADAAANTDLRQPSAGSAKPAPQAITRNKPKTNPANPGAKSSNRAAEKKPAAPIILQ